MKDKRKFHGMLFCKKEDFSVNTAEPRKKKWGDRRDAVWVKDVPSLSALLTNLFPTRTDSEVFAHQEIDVTELLKFIDSKNGPEAPYKTTMFHCFVTMVARVLIERPYLNRFIQGRRFYQRNDITVSFVAKRKFADHSEESLMQYKVQGRHTVDDVSRLIVGDVKEMREADGALGLNETIDKLAKLPRFVLMFIMRMLRWMDFWDLVPRDLMKGDSNFSSVLLSNLGSIKCPSVYHHLNNYGSNSIIITIGTIHKAPVLQSDGSIQIRDVMDIGATLDERIADGFYFARSLKLIQHICSHPELLDRPLEESSQYEFV